jgi:diguanylate cyclase (GGDEF)-like protein
MYDKEILDIFDRLKIVEKLYDHIRLVDPVLMRVISNGDKETELQMNCFAFWNRNEVCNNCVSIKAYNDDQTYVKLEYNNQEIYMVTAIPVQLADRKVVVELLKNVTGSMVFQGSNAVNETTVTGMIENINLIASKDALTGIFNRRYIYEKLPADLVNAIIANRRLAVVMTDIDHFKYVNDTYGHLTGDYVLKTFAELLTRNLKRETDWVARYGGEEFLICIPGASKDVALEIAEHMRKALEETVMSFNGSSFKITASFGVCHLVPTNDMKIEDIIECADKNLYLAKNNGRNRVEG